MPDKLFLKITKAEVVPLSPREVAFKSDFVIINLEDIFGLKLSAFFLGYIH